MKYLLLAIMFCIGINMNAQNKVFGTLQNENGEALIGASVFLQESQFATITDDTGFFELQSIPRDTYDFKITFLGYKSYTESIVVDGDIKMDIVLDGVVFNLDKIEILANELDQNSPFVYSEMGKEEISFENLGQDLPFLLEQTPSVVVTSDAGAGIGYTGMRVRGSDPTRVNVTINGVPLNDSESHGLFWVNLPDFASSVDKVQIQRGVGPSTNGAGAFGATVSLNSNYIYQNPYIHISGSYGSFNSQKISASFGTGLIADKYNIEGRYSRIVSDGYIDRASSNLNSFYFSASKVEENKSIRFNVFSGKERTYQSWNGIPEAKLEEDDEALMAHYLRNPGMYQTVEDSLNLFESDRRYNYYLYENQVDDYRQTHLQFIYNVKTSDNVNINATAHYTRGKGFFEQFEVNQDFADYGFGPVITSVGDTLNSANLVRRKWLDNHFYGVIINSEIAMSDNLDLILGASANRYDGLHFGRPVGAEVNGILRLLDEDFRYYENDGSKNDFNVYGKVNYLFSDKLKAYLDLQMRVLDYNASGIDDDRLSFNIEQSYSFFNPKFGLSYNLNNNTIVYASYAKAQREPVRSDFVDAKGTNVPESETLNDIEFGLRMVNNNTLFNANVFYMDYKNQLVLTGAINDVGAAVRQNVDKSTRMGIELDGQIDINSQFKLKANVAFSQNKIDQFTESIVDYGADPISIVENNYTDTDIAFSPNIIAGSTFSYLLTKALSIHWISKYVGEQFLDNTSNVNKKIDAYFINDILVSFKSKSQGITQYELKAMVNNVLDTKYVSNGYTYNYIFENLVEENFYFPQAGINFLIGFDVTF